MTIEEMNEFAESLSEKLAINEVGTFASFMIDWLDAHLTLAQFQEVGAILGAMGINVTDICKTKHPT